MSNYAKLKTQKSKVKTKTLNVKIFCHPERSEGSVSKIIAFYRFFVAKLLRMTNQE